MREKDFQLRLSLLSAHYSSGLVPIKSAKSTLSGLRRLGYFATTGTAIYLDFVRVGRDDSLRRPLQKTLCTVPGKREHIRIVREQLLEMWAGISGFLLSCQIRSPVRDFFCGRKMPIRKLLFLGHEARIVGEDIASEIPVHTLSPSNSNGSGATPLAAPRSPRP